MGSRYIFSSKYMILSLSKEGIIWININVQSADFYQ